MGHKAISPYIYGVNSGVDLSAVSAKSFRLGVNRLSACNWENNMSNAGSDWHNSSDIYLVQNTAEEFPDVLADVIFNAAYDARKWKVTYTLITLQMLGYVSSAKSGEVKEENAAPSDYWIKVVNRKGGEFVADPDLTDNKVYMDELLNYLITNLGKSDTETCIKAYSLDNEPALWQHTHSLVQREPLFCAKLIEKSVDLAAVVKVMDGVVDISVYSSIDGEDEITVKIIVTNRLIHDDTPVSITLSSDKTYESAVVYSLYGDSPLVCKLDGVGEITENGFTYTLPAHSVTEFVISVPQAEPEVSEVLSESASESGGNNALPFAIGGVAAVGAAAAVTTFVRNKKKK